LQKRVLGQTDIEVSAIGLGTVKFGRNQGVKYPAAFSLPSDDEIKNLLSVARELNINLLDTAPAYGVSEERIGKLLQGARNDWVICTKAGEEFSDGESHYDFSKTAITQSVERSLQRLRTDYLDVVLIHSNGDDARIIEEENAFATLASLKSAGKIRAYGMSTKTVSGGMLAIDHADVAMVTYNHENVEDGAVIRHAHQQKKGIFIKKAFASGHMKMPVSECMRFIFSEPGVTSVIVGTINEKHLRENVECYGISNNQ
jgi:aryl-alcohol dehydrogenase-like predicted oxidoreductase